MQRHQLFLSFLAFLIILTEVVINIKRFSENLMETLKSFLKEFAILAPDAAPTANPQGDDTQIDVTSQDNGGADDTVVNVDPDKDQEQECVCKCDCPCCQKARAEAGGGSVDDNIEVVDPKDDDTVDFNIDDETGSSDEEDENDPLKDYDIF
jgi:hypothetical protein